MPGLTVGKKLVRFPGAQGWVLQGGRYRVMRPYTYSNHHWYVEELDDDRWFRHAPLFGTIDAAIEYVEAL